MNESKKLPRKLILKECKGQKDRHPRCVAKLHKIEKCPMQSKEERVTAIKRREGSWPGAASEGQTREARGAAE